LIRAVQPAPDTLLARLAREIAARGPLSFDRFMERALYDPDGGYYAGRAGRIGPSGDFVTASDFGRAFGRCLARQLAEFDRCIGPLDPFWLVEFGAGRGLLSRDTLDALAQTAPALAARVRAVAVERSPALRAQARRELPEAEVVAPEALGGGHRGCVVAVELFDAVPVRRIRRRAGQLVEILVGADGEGRLVELEGPAPPEVRALAERYGAAAAEGSEAELAPAAAILLERLAATLDRGFLVIVDYGDRAGALYGAARRGTLVAYHRHRTSDEVLARVGEQDLTAHVNFSLLEDRASQLGLRVLGLTTQDRFLVANGILEEFVQDGRRDGRDPVRVKRRLQALPLIHPEAMGRRFKVLVLAKDVPEGPPLAGLRDPFARDGSGP
jgi:SAM-dependent MidA family methyltransferase